jgi:hypothetical protein
VQRHLADVDAPRLERNPELPFGDGADVTGGLVARPPTENDDRGDQAGGGDGTENAAHGGTP